MRVQRSFTRSLHQSCRSSCVQQRQLRAWLLCSCPSHALAAPEPSSPLLFLHLPTGWPIVTAQVATAKCLLYHHQLLAFPLPPVPGRFYNFIQLLNSEICAWKQHGTFWRGVDITLKMSAIDRWPYCFLKYGFFGQTNCIACVWYVCSLCLLSEKKARTFPKVGQVPFFSLVLMSWCGAVVLPSAKEQNTALECSWSVPW